MEKRIKTFSIVSIILLLVFILTSLLAAGMAMRGQEGSGLFVAAYYIMNALLLVAPIAGMINFAMGAFCIVKRRNEVVNVEFGRKNDVKFPTAYFVTATILFVLVLLFIIFIMSL